MNKVLVVVPAHNESGNIEGVISDIRENFSEADMLVINDCSTDNTEEILKNLGINHVNNVFNVGYAMSIQTGIKYAQQNGYQYVVQMDADGQHAAKDARKLYDEAIKSGSDIIIGSRYITKTGYKCPLMRRIGTKLFEITIRIFCHKKVSDPLSGFQCINSKVMKLYSRSDFYPEFPDANLIMEMLYRGFSIKEVPVTMRLRTQGESMHSGFIKPVKYMANMFYAITLIILQNIRRSHHE